MSIISAYLPHILLMAGLLVAAPFIFRISHEKDHK